MNTEFTVTLPQIVRGFLAVCGGISVVCVAVSWVLKAIRLFRKPEQTQNERITAIENRLETHEDYFRKDKARLESIEEGNRLTQKAILALLRHGIDGNEIDGMKKAESELQDYLIGR